MVSLPRTALRDPVPAATLDLQDTEVQGLCIRQIVCVRSDLVEILLWGSTKRASPNVASSTRECHLTHRLGHHSDIASIIARLETRLGPRNPLLLPVDGPGKSRANSIH
jgi:hypothetical protein